MEITFSYISELLYPILLTVKGQQKMGLLITVNITTM